MKFFHPSSATLVAVLAVAPVGACDPEHMSPKAEADADADTDSDSDSDADGDSDADADTDTGGDDTGGDDPLDVDDDGDGFTENQDDCDDADATVYPGAAEVYDAKDNDCDDTTDNGWMHVKVFAPGDTSVALDFEAVYSTSDLGTIESDDWEDAGGYVTVDSDGWATWTWLAGEFLVALRGDVDLAGDNNTCEGYGGTASLRTTIVVQYEGASYEVTTYSMSWWYDGVQYTGCSFVAYFF